MAFLAESRGAPGAYIAGHLTRRFGCDGELQYLCVTPLHRRLGIATAPLAKLAEWFAQHDAHRICFDVGSADADAFYAERRAELLRPHRRVWPYVRVLIVRPPCVVRVARSSTTRRSTSSSTGVSAAPDRERGLHPPTSLFHFGVWRRIATDIVTERRTWADFDPAPQRASRGR